jgi:hypothetical protein
MGNGCTDPRILNVGTTQKQAISFPLGLPPFGERTPSPGIHWECVWVCTRVGLDAAEKGKICYLYQESKPNPSAVLTVASHYTTELSYCQELNSVTCNGSKPHRLLLYYKRTILRPLLERHSSHIASVGSREGMRQ